MRPQLQHEYVNWRHRAAALGAAGVLGYGQAKATEWVYQGGKWVVKTTGNTLLRGAQNIGSAALEYAASGNTQMPTTFGPTGVPVKPGLDAMDVEETSPPKKAVRRPEVALSPDQKRVRTELLKAVQRKKAMDVTPVKSKKVKTPPPIEPPPRPLSRAEKRLIAAQLIAQSARYPYFKKAGRSKSKFRRGVRT